MENVRLCCSCHVGVMDAIVYLSQYPLFKLRFLPPTICCPPCCQLFVWLLFGGHRQQKHCLYLHKSSGKNNSNNREWEKERGVWEWATAASGASGTTTYALPIRGQSLRLAKGSVNFLPLNKVAAPRQRPQEAAHT